MDKQPRVFEITNPNLDKFNERWEKLVRKANKLGVIPPSYIILKEEPRTHQVKRERFNELKNTMEYYMEDVVILYSFVVINHPVVKVNGWEFVSALEHTEEGNITHNIGGRDLPAEYRDCEPWCDHCQLKRNRKDSFVVVNDQQEYKQIGRNCLSLYFGIDGTHFANMAEIYYTARELAEASGGESWGGGSGPYFDYLDKYLSHVAEVIALDGWVSRATAKQKEIASTSDIAYRHMHPSPYERRSDRLYDQPSGKSEELAKEAIAWVENLPDSVVDNSEYLHNIRVIARRGIVGAKQYGFAASIVSSWQREKIRLAKILQPQTVSEYVGEIKKRQNFTVIVEQIKPLVSDFGTTHLHLMVDLHGNRLKWFSTSKVLELGKPIQIKATPQKHEVYNGVKETVINRCTVIEEKENYIGLTQSEIAAHMSKL